MSFNFRCHLDTDNHKQENMENTRSNYTLVGVNCVGQLNLRLLESDVVETGLQTMSMGGYRNRHLNDIPHVSLMALPVLEPFKFGIF